MESWSIGTGQFAESPDAAIVGIRVPGRTYDTDQPAGKFHDPVIQSFPGAAIPVMGNGSYIHCGTITSNEEHRNFAEVHLRQYDRTSGAPPM